MKKNKNILVLGPQGSGKDTQSEMLARHLKIPFIAMGNLFRREIREKTEIGRKVSAQIKKGNLASDKIALFLLAKRLRKRDTKKGYVLNGFPRNLKQAKALEKISEIGLAIQLFVSDKESLRRLSGRRICPVCGATYHLQYKPPKKSGLCDSCQRNLIVRDDDKPKAIKKRLAIYHQATEPLLDHYREKGIYLKINGEQPIPDVFKEIKEKLKFSQ